ncbi:hypothetical protein QE152_g22806 [Popillia japonica]|uniref:Uncharacterized protein n=1 Tax=Popillia japonica TaxID=7064 RepID=A0AAW1KHR5_POPJA
MPAHTLAPNTPSRSRSRKATADRGEQGMDGGGGYEAASSRRLPTQTRLNIGAGGYYSRLRCHHRLGGSEPADNGLPPEFMRTSFTRATGGRGRGDI